MAALTKTLLNQLGYEIIGAAIEVHLELGPGLLESIYEECLTEELHLRGIEVERQIAVPITYKGRPLRAPLRLDLLVQQQIIVEVKAVEFVLPVHEAQILSYMKLARKPKGMLINFNVDRITTGSMHFANELFAALPR